MDDRAREQREDGEEERGELGAVPPRPAEQQDETQPDGEYARSDFFVAMVLADAHADQDDPEQACHVALDALRIGQAITSARCTSYVREFRQRLHRFSGNAAVRDFEEQARDFTLWETVA